MSSQGPQISKTKPDEGLNALEIRREPTPEVHTKEVDLSSLSTIGTSLKVERKVEEGLETAAERKLSVPKLTQELEAPTPKITQKLETRRAPTLEPKKDARASTQQSAGIVKNPHFRYHGGPFMRIITMLANILKAIERWLLKALTKLPILRKLVPIKKKETESTPLHEVRPQTKTVQGRSNSIRFSGGDT